MRINTRTNTRHTAASTLLKRFMQTITAVVLTIGLTTIGHLGLQSSLSTVYGNPNHFKPDFTKYKPVHTKDYTGPDLYWREVADWKTPTGIECSVTGGLDCIGLRIPKQLITTPKDNPQPGKCYYYRLSIDYLPNSRWGENGNAGVLDDGFTEPCYFSPYKLLPKGYKITYQDFTCAVGKEIDLACTNGIHGFVITPTDGWKF